MNFLEVDKVNFLIDRKLAAALGLEVHDVSLGSIMVIGKHDTYIFSPTRYMDHAWRVAEAFEFSKLEKTCDGYYQAYLATTRETAAIGIDKSAPIAICKAALKVIEQMDGDGS
jgi:hypothetical protein